ncbi:hypothetical protein FSARC_11791 [Fusarium sarcochroum]|uniref:1-alkyl-2-acetylglycerophosphocholine esterase n=1 Tax=Fusarium sarcochroum TaxID=1208366 RepID=A0A8H4TD28_9HYPO|nr:hypothetical protein FSARC_11791 [Fusarium sarcochroum]
MNCSDPTSGTLCVAAYGHSLGGSTSQNALVFDSRVVGAINIDGPVFGPARNASASKPFLILGSEELSPTSLAPQLSEIYNNYNGWKSWTWVNNTVHYDFTDEPVFANAVNFHGDYFLKVFPGSIGSTRNQETHWRMSYPNVFLRAHAELKESR